MIEESHSISQEPCDDRPVEMLFTAQKAMSDERRMRFGLAERRAALARLAAVRPHRDELLQVRAVRSEQVESEALVGKQRQDVGVAARCWSGALLAERPNQPTLAIRE